MPMIVTPCSHGVIEVCRREDISRMKPEEALQTGK